MSVPRKVRCTVSAITAHGGGVYTVELSPAGSLPAFRPGQFLHLTVDEYDPGSFWPESRVFSIASAPQQGKHLRVCYSVKGRYTTRMEQVLKVGSEVWVKLPYGEFVIEPSADVVLLAGGTGISAFIAFIEGLSPQHPHQVWLAYGARSPELWLFRERIDSQLAAVPNFHVLLFTETGAAGRTSPALPATREVACFPGRISLEALWACVPQPERKVFYLSGPPVMLNSLRGELRSRSIATEQIRTDAWE